MNIKKTVPNFTSLAKALVTLFGNSVAIAHTDRLNGGDINRAYALTLNTGDKIFMKANAKNNASYFTAEATGLSAIADTHSIATPKILCTGTDDGEDVGYSFLLLSFITTGKKNKQYWESFAYELAQMHKSDCSTLISENKNTANSFGFFMDNFIGAHKQINTPSANWCDFFRDFRLVPQFHDADSYFTTEDRAKITKLLDNLENFLVEPEAPSLLHGDLWNGNVMCSPDGKAVLIDPACYIGNREADLAMTQLFGGFPQVFYDAYNEFYPLQPDYTERLDLYNLYQLLNHLNLFGPTYLEPVLGIIGEYVN